MRDPRDADGTRYIVMVRAHGTDRPHTVHLTRQLAIAEAARLCACGFEARVAEGRPTAPSSSTARYRKGLRG